MNQLNKSKKRKTCIPGAITLAMCVFLAFGVMVIFPACGPKDDGTWMSCHYAQLTVFALALVMAALSAVSLFVNRTAGMICLAFVILCAISSAAIPGNVIRLCMMNEMQCRAVMRPSVILISILIAVFSLFSLLMRVANKTR